MRLLHSSVAHCIALHCIQQVFIRVAHGTEDPEARTAVSVLRQRSASDVNKKGFNSNGDPVVETKSDVPDVPYAMTATAEGVKRLQRQRSDSTLANTEVCILTVCCRHMMHFATSTISMLCPHCTLLCSAIAVYTLISWIAHGNGRTCTPALYLLLLYSTDLRLTEYTTTACSEDSQASTDDTSNKV
jgi:hypothetical protein